MSDVANIDKKQAQKHKPTDAWKKNPAFIDKQGRLGTLPPDERKSAQSKGGKKGRASVKLDNAFAEIAAQLLGIHVNDKFKAMTLEQFPDIDPETITNKTGLISTAVLKAIEGSPAHLELIMALTGELPAKEVKVHSNITEASFQEFLHSHGVMDAPAPAGHKKGKVGNLDESPAAPQS